MREDGKRVAVIDDEAEIGELVERILSREFDVDVYEDVRAFYANLERGRIYDAILCDLHMPEQSGGEIYEQMDRRWPRQGRSMIFMSGVPTSEMKKLLPDNASYDLIEKPFDLEALRRLVRRVSERSPDAGRRTRP